MKPKTIFIIGFVLILALVAIFIATRKKPAGVPPPGSEPAPEQTPTAAPGEAENAPRGPLQAFSAERAVSYWLSPDALFYVSDKGTLLAVEILPAQAGGKESAVSEDRFERLLAVHASASGTKTAIAYAGRGASLVSLFSSEDRVLSHLAADTVVAAPSPDGTRLVQIRDLFGGRRAIEVITLANPPAQTGEKKIELAVGGFLDADVFWTDNTHLFLITSRPSRHSAASAFLIDAATAEMVPLALEKLGLSFLWSPDGSRALAYWIDAQEGTGKSAIIDAKGTVLKQLQVPLLPAKCAFAHNASLLCGLPKNADFLKGNNLPDAYLTQELQTEDQIGVLDLDSGRLSIVFDREGTSLDIYKPQVANGLLYFIDRFTGRIHSLQL